MSSTADNKESVVVVVKNSVTGIEDLPVINLDPYLNKESNSESVWQSECTAIAHCLTKYGCLVIKDPRVTMKDNDAFIDQMEQYYEQPKNVKLEDIRPEVFYQVGATPDGVEQARDHCARVKLLDDADRPLTMCPPEADPKWRFFWRMGEKPPKTEFASLNMPQVIPKSFPNWGKVMDRWGSLVLDSVLTVASMAAIGFGLPVDSFTSLMRYGPHLLAPTGADLAHETYGKLGTVFANYHYDLNFMTIHGRSRFPGLYIWTRDGKKLIVKVPEGCLLIQAGKQFEILTGGTVLAGFHEVVVNQATVDAVTKAKKDGKSVWRVSSTLFSHIASDQTLQPLGKFATKESIESFPPVKAGTQVQNELSMIKLRAERKDEAITKILQQANANEQAKDDTNTNTNTNSSTTTTTTTTTSTTAAKEIRELELKTREDVNTSTSTTVNSIAK
jgi:isopenicillin N synthase-like dioxygenase